MERDFLSLGSGKEVSSGSVPARGLGMRWSFPNKVSALPHFLPFKTAQDDKPRRSVCDYPLATPGLMSMSTADAIESNQKPHSGVVQKNLNLENQVGSQFVMTGYPVQHLSAQSVHHVHEVGKFPASNQPNESISIDFSKLVLQSQIAFSVPSMGNSAAKPQPLGGVPVAASFPATCSFIGTTGQRNASKLPGPASQLTIFYGGSVNVFDGVSPEKAQAIMLLAGNGLPVTLNTTLSTPQGQGQTTIMHSGGDDGFMGKKTHPSQPGSGLPTLSHLGSQPGGGSNGNDELMAGNIKGTLLSTIRPEPAKVVTSLVSTTPTYIPAVPQARKASLARFLEKRKERMMNASPYNSSKKFQDCIFSGSHVVGFPMNSAGSCSSAAMD